MNYGHETVWTFMTPNFEVTLTLYPQHDYQYDGDDEDGETQRQLDEGELIAFDSKVEVRTRGTHSVHLATEWLCGSVYKSDDYEAFYTDHRTSSAEYRNTLAQKAQRRVICHYFPDMVRIAISEARRRLAEHGRFKLRANAVEA